MSPRRLRRALGFTLCCTLGATDANALTLAQGRVSELFEVTTFIEALTQPTDFRLLPDGRSVVTERVGDVVIVLPDGERFATHINVQANHGEQGLLGVVAHPRFADNHYLYFYASAAEDENNRHQVIRYTLGDDNLLIEPQVIVSMGLRGPANHNGGGLEFYGGALYISVGDTGQNATPPVNKLGTCLNVANGKILRVDPETGDPFPGNPLIGLEEVTGCDGRNGELKMFPPDERIFAWGLRNPFRFWVDPRTGKMWIGDVGEKAREEVSVGDGAQHFGWPFFEGKVEYDQPWKPTDGCRGIVPPSDCVVPAFEFVQSAAGAAVIGGRILDACDWPEGYGERYFFGDFNRGLIYSFEVNAARDGVVGGTAAFGAVGGLSSFRFMNDNALYVTEFTGGRVSRITAKGAPTVCVRALDGEACETGAGCASNRCVDGVCCRTDCDGACEACTQDLTGVQSGECAPIVAGEDPEDECEADAGFPESCLADGACDGAGACREVAEAETICASQCTGSAALVSQCDGQGSCVEVEPVACAPYTCGGEACLTECESNDDCQPTLVCLDGACEEPTTCATSDDCEPGQTCGPDHNCEDDTLGAAGGAGAPAQGGQAGATSAPDAEAAVDDGGCSCRASGGTGHSGATAAGLALSLLVARRRRRPRLSSR